MTTKDSISQAETGQSSASAHNPKKTGKAATGADEQPMTKPSMLVMLVPILLIALAIYLAR